MPRFFVDEIFESRLSIRGGDAAHIHSALRMKPGEQLEVCNKNGTAFKCEIEALDKDQVLLNIIEKLPSNNEPAVRVTLYQCLPKGGKLEEIVQKAVELGVHKIVPVLSCRCVSRPDEKAAVKKSDRLQKIAGAAAEQSGRGIIPGVTPMTPFNQATEMFGQHERGIVFYENGGAPLSELIAGDDRDIGIFIGPEGGIDRAELEQLLARGAKAATLGPRILRTQTAPVAALAVIMQQIGRASCRERV